MKQIHKTIQEHVGAASFSLDLSHRMQAAFLQEAAKRRGEERR